MRFQVTPEGPRYRCDACGHWQPSAWLFRGQVYCPDCYVSVRPQELWERSTHAEQVARYLIERAKALRATRPRR